MDPARPGVNDPEGRLSRAELEAHARVDPALVDRLCELGILAAAEDGTFGGGDAYRVRLLEACDRAGLTPEAIARGIGDQRVSLGFLDLPQYRWAGAGDETYGELAARLGVPVEILLELVVSMGGGRPSADDRTREDDETILGLATFAAGMVGVDPVARLSRVYVDAFRRMTDAEASFFDTHMVGVFEAQGLSYQEAIDRASEAGAQMADPMERMILALYRRQQEHGWTQGIVEGLERLVAASTPGQVVGRPSAFAFVDLAGYTALTDQRGDEEGARLARDLGRLVERWSDEHGGTPVKWLGDGVMVHFRDIPQAVRATLGIVATAPDVGLPAHAGIAAGPVVMQDGDYFGRTVNLASRVSGVATAGQTLVTDLVVELAGGSDLDFRPAGTRTLKGFSEPVAVYEAGAGV